MQYQINPTQATILGLLHDGPMTGGDINAMAQKWMTPYWRSTRSHYYRELPILAKMGYLKAGEPGKRGAVKYKVTAAGKRAFQNWLNQEPGEGGIRNEMALRVAFSALNRGNGMTDKVWRVIEYHEKALRDIKALSHEAEDEDMDGDYAALRFAEGYHKAAINWLKSLTVTEA